MYLFTRYDDMIIVYKPLGDKSKKKNCKISAHYIDVNLKTPKVLYRLLQQPDQVLSQVGPKQNWTKDIGRDGKKICEAKPDRVYLSTNHGPELKFHVTGCARASNYLFPSTSLI